MHILFITTAFPPLVDGVGDYTYNLAQEFVNNGHQAIVVCKKKTWNKDRLCKYLCMPDY